MKIFKDQRGQSTIILAMSITCLCGLAGFAVDIGTLFKDKRVLQTAADAGAIAAAAEVSYGDASTAAKAATALNGATDGSNGVTVTVNSPPTSGPNSGKTGYAEVIVAQVAPTYFMKVLNISTVTVKARSVGVIASGSGCIYTEATSGKGIDMSGSATLNLPGCSVNVNSSATNGINLSGSAGITAKSIGIVGGYQSSSSVGFSPSPVTSVVPTPNPLGYLTAPTFLSSSCVSDPHPGHAATYGPVIAGGTICYNGFSDSGQTVTLNPGLYIINGNFQMSGSASITGTGVTIYLAPPNSSISLSGSSALNISAPTSGTWNGILVFQDPSDTQTLQLSGSSGGTMEGIVYAPSAQLQLSGSSGETMYVDLVVSSLTLSGSANIKNYNQVNANSPIGAATIVE